MDEGEKLFRKLLDILHGKYDSKYTSSQINFSRLFPDSESSTKKLNRLKKYIEKVFNLIKNCKNDYEGLNSLLEAGLSNLFVQAFTVIKKEASVEGVTQLLDDLLEIVNLIAECGEKSQSLLVTALCGPYLKLMVEEAFTLLQQTEICRSLNILLETCPFAAKEVLLKQTSFINKLSDLFQLVIRVGDYECQIGILECLFRLLPRKIRPQYACKFLQQSILVKFLDICDVNFETDCRIFLNEINRTVGNNGRVYSIPCEKAFLGKKQLRKPSDDEYEEFWVDFNYGSRRITLFCEQDDVTEIGSQFSQSELGLWETITVSTADVKSYSYTEENGLAVASVELKKNIGTLYPHMAQHQGKDFLIYVEIKYNMKKALMTVFGSEKCLTKKISSVITPVQLRVERSHDQKSISPQDNAQPNSAGQAALTQFTQNSQRSYQDFSPKRVKMSVPCVLMSTPASSVGSPMVKTAYSRPAFAGNCVQETKSNGKDKFQAPKTPTVKQVKPKVKTPVVEVGECPKKKDTRNKKSKKKCVKNVEIGTDVQASVPDPLEDNDVIPDSFPGSQMETNFVIFPALSDSGIDVTEVHRGQKITEPQKEITKSRSESYKRPVREHATEQMTTSNVDLPSSAEDMVIQETQETVKKYKEDSNEEDAKEDVSRSHRKRNKHNKSSQKESESACFKNKNKYLTNTTSKKIPNYSPKAILELEDNPDVSISPPVESSKVDSVRDRHKGLRKGRGKSQQNKQIVVGSEPSTPASEEEKKTNATAKSLSFNKIPILSDQVSLEDDVFEEEPNVNLDRQKNVIMKDCKKSKKEIQKQNKENMYPKGGYPKETTMNKSKVMNKDLTKEKDIPADCENQVEDKINRKDTLETKHQKGRQDKKNQKLSKEVLETADSENQSDEKVNFNKSESKPSKLQPKKKNKDHYSEETDISKEKNSSKDVRKLPSRKAKQNQVYNDSKNDSNSGSTVTAGFLFRSPGETASNGSSVTSYTDDTKSNQTAKKGGRKLLNQSGLYFPDHSYGSQESDPYDFDAECDSVPSMPVAKYSSKSDKNLQQNKSAAVTSKFFKHRRESRKLNRTAETIATTYMKSWQQQLNKKKGSKTKVLSQSVVSWKSVEHFEDHGNYDPRDKKAKEVNNKRKSKKETSQSKKITSNSSSLKENRKEVDESFNMPSKKKNNASKFKLFNPDLSVLMPTEDNDIEIGDESDAEEDANSTSYELSPNLNNEESETKQCQQQLPNSPCHKKKKQRGKSKQRKQKAERHKPSLNNSPCNRDVAENLSNMCKTLMRSSRIENGAEDNQRHPCEKKCDNNKVLQQNKQVTEESDGELSEENRTIATSVRSELSWIAKKTASRKKKIKKTYKRNIDSTKRLNGSFDEDIVIESLRFRDEEKEDLVMSSQEWGVPTKFSIEDVVTPKISSIKTPNIPSSKKRYSPLDVKFIQTPKTPKTPASYHFSDEENELLIEEDNYNFDVQVPKAMEIIREYTLPLGEGKFTARSSMKKIQSGPSSTVRPSRSTLKRKYSHLNLQDDQVDSPESSQGNQIDRDEDISAIEFCPRKLFKRSVLQEYEREDDEEPTEVKTPNLLQAMKQKTLTKSKTTPVLDVPRVQSPLQDISSCIENKKQKSFNQTSEFEMPSLPSPVQDISSYMHPQMSQLQTLLFDMNKPAFSKKPKKKTVSESESELETSEDGREQGKEQASLWGHRSPKRGYGGRRTQGCQMAERMQFQFVNPPVLTVTTEDEQFGDADPAFDLTSDMGIETGISTVVQAFGIDIQKQLKTKYQQLKEITKGALKNSQKHVRNIWCEEYEHRGRALEHFKDKMLEELLVLETDVTALGEAEERSLNFCLQQKEVIEKNRKSQEARLRNFKILYSSLQCSLNESENESLHKQKKLKQIMKADLATLQKRLLFESNQHHISNVKKCLKSMIF